MKRTFVLLAGMLMVGSNSSALADCGWVLWKKSDVLDIQPARRGAPKNPTWDIENATPGFEGCQKALKDTLDAYSKQGPLEDKPRSRGTDSVTFALPGREGVMIIKFLCLPAAVNPRG